MTNYFFSSSNRLLFISLSLILLWSCKEEKPRAVDIPAHVDTRTKAENLPLKLPSDTLPSKFDALPTWPMHRQAGTFHPFDEATKDPTLVAFRKRLWQAIQEKDVRYVTKVLHEHIRIGFDEQNGKQAFIQNWQLYSDPKNSSLWLELGDVLRLGGAFGKHSNMQFCAPYIFSLEDLEEPFEDGVIIGEGVRLRSLPNRTAKVMKTLNWDKVKILPQSPPTSERIDGEVHDWEKIQTADGTTGYVYGKYLRLPVDYRVWLEKDKQGWKLTSFLAGD